MIKRIAVVGSGAIGLYYGSKLARAGLEVHFLLRKDYDAVRSRGSIRVDDRGEKFEIKAPSVHRKTEEIGPVDLVLVTLKATANSDLPKLIPPLLGRETAILILQNGLGPDEYLAGLFGGERVMGGLAFICCNRTGPGEAACVLSEALTIGEFSGPPLERTKEIVGHFVRAGIDGRLAENLTMARWRKLVWNIPFNGLTIAAGGITTDQVCSDPVLAAETRALMKEVQAAAARNGHAIPDEFVVSRFDITPPMGAYRPSSLIDYNAGREVEVEAIWGEPLRRGLAAGAEMPRLSLLYALLRRMVAVRTHG